MLIIRSNSIFTIDKFKYSDGVRIFSDNMSQAELLNKLTSNDIRIQDKAEQLGIPKQTFYNYIKYYENGELAKIPDVVRDYFSIIMNESFGEKAIEQAERYWESKLQYSNASKEKLVILNSDLKATEMRLQEIQSKLGPGYDMACGPEIDELNAEKERYEAQRKRIIKEISTLEKDLKNSTDNLKKKSAPKENVSENEKVLNAALAISPSWDVSPDLLESLSVRNNGTGDCTIYYSHEDAPAKAEVFAAIGGDLVKIATYRNKDNENFVSFRLVGELEYFYKLTVYSEGGPFSSEYIKI